MSEPEDCEIASLLIRKWAMKQMEENYLKGSCKSIYRIILFSIPNSAPKYASLVILLSTDRRKKIVDQYFRLTFPQSLNKLWHERETGK